MGMLPNGGLQRRCICAPSGFTLVELAVVVVIIGVLAAFAVPRFLASVERSKAAEAFNFLSSVQAAQERYHARQGTYADELTDLDIKMTHTEVFHRRHDRRREHRQPPGLLDADADPGGRSAGYGEYTVTFTEEGYDGENSTINDLPDINPMQT